MSKKIPIVMCLLLASLVTQLFAEDLVIKKRDVYTKTFAIERIYVCRYGYMVGYRSSDYSLQELYIANKFFAGTTGKASIVWGKGPEYPYLSVTWIDGQVDNIRIYAVDSLSGVYVLHGTDDELKAKFPDQLEVKF